MHGPRRVIVFCLLTAVLPTILLIIPLYLRHSVFSDVIFAVAESDILEITDGVSSFFCQEHTVQMNTSFNAYQITGKPETGNFRKHIRLKKSMRLVDDTLEYWGFYLMKGSTVNLSLCSRYEGSRLLVVSGEKNLRTCGLLQHAKKEAVRPQIAHDQGEVKVTFESYVMGNAIPAEKKKSVYSTTANYDEEEVEEEANMAEDEDEIKESKGLQNFLRVAKMARSYIEQHNLDSDINSKQNLTVEEKLIGRRLRHARSRTKHTSNTHFVSESTPQRRKRSVDIRIGHTLDAKVAHGNTGKKNFTIDSAESAVSSFENNLLTCYDGNILLSQGFHPSLLCTDIKFFDSSAERMVTTHNVLSDGYYYYIFYSDNDFVVNDIHAVFDIYKPTYQFANNTNRCVNQTSCTFGISLGSDQTVIVEIPTSDGIKVDEDVLFLTSTCHPRMGVYVIFPILVLFLILGCAFL